VARFRATQISLSGIIPGKLGEWNNVWLEESEMWIIAAASAVRSAFRRMFPTTHACSQVKWAKVNVFSSRERPLSDRVGEGSWSSMAEGNFKRKESLQ
jgi:hypothetical protein